MKSEIELAWAAGLFDGEGTIFASARKLTRINLVMQIAMTTPEPIERFVEAIGCGACCKLTTSTTAGNSVYRWRIEGTQDVRDCIEKLWPYLSGPKIRQAAVALAQRDEYELKVVSV